MAFDYKKACKEFYLPGGKPQLVIVPEMTFLAIQGRGDPNQPGGAYQDAIGKLYAVAYTIKMSKLGQRKMAGYFDFVVPPLEGFWWQEGREDLDYRRKEDFRWRSVIRVPDFVTQADFRWAVEEAERKKGLSLAELELWTLEEGLCVQMLHTGPFDREPESLERMEAFLQREGCEKDLSPLRRHHEIYLSDARRVLPERWRTVLRLPVRKL